MQCVLDQQELVRRVTAVLEKSQGRIKAAVLDQIVSFPPVVLPLTELIAACRTVRYSSFLPFASANSLLVFLDIFQGRLTSKPNYICLASLLHAMHV